MAYHFKNLVFEGGGVKGIAYLGVQEILEEKDILSRIARIGGTSAGAINAVLLGLNFSPAEAKEILWKLDFNNFLDSDWGVIRDFKRFRDEYGWYKGNYFRNWIGKLIKQKTGNSEATFADIEKLKDKSGFRSLYLVGTNLSTGFSEVFSAEHTPRMCVADAARISMSLPFFFAAIRSLRGDVYVDGGVTDNYPIKLFDREKYLDTENFLMPDYYKKTNRSLNKNERPVSKYVYNKESLGFRLDSSVEIDLFRDHAEPPRRTIDDLFSYMLALGMSIYKLQDNYHLHSDDWQRTVYIDTLGVGTADFSLSEAKKQALYDSGKKGSEAYFKWYDNEEPKANK
ncbi:MAG: patatin-like phospholipase family protein [Azoarcus sp.]|jgi:NTE family protein|nr:patatin-like phospholipase family protein [Azoarcus sp.]